MHDELSQLRSATVDAVTALAGIAAPVSHLLNGSSEEARRVWDADATRRRIQSAIEKLEQCARRAEMTQEASGTARITRRQAAVIESVVATIVERDTSDTEGLRASSARKVLLREFAEINARTSWLPAVWPFRR
jgi:hypothetical protein